VIDIASAFLARTADQFCAPATWNFASPCTFSNDEFHQRRDYMTDIKGKDPILQKTQPNESPAQKKNVARGVVWAMIGLGVATLLYFVFVFVIAGARA
jgi:hypothetical protein